MFFVLKKTIGIRVTDAEQISGLDLPEHGLVSAYPDFTPSLESISGAYGVTGSVKVDDAVPIEIKSAGVVASDTTFTKIEIITRQESFDKLKDAMNKIGVMGMTVTNVLGCGVQHGKTEKYRGVDVDITLRPKIKVEIVVCKVPVSTVVNEAQTALYTGNIGDGKIFVYGILDVLRVRTKEQGYDALQDE